MQTHPAYVHAKSDQEKVVGLALAQNIKAVPVVDENEAFIGVITADTLLEILQKEHTEDILKTVGINYQPIETSTYPTLFTQLRSRLPWLLVGLGGGLVAAFVVEHFTSILERNILLAAFIPTIVYIADAVGSQSQMINVRRYTSVHTERFLHTFTHEFSVAIILGAILSGIIYLLTHLWLNDLQVSIILGTTVFATVLFSVCVAIVLPKILMYYKQDPVVATGPLATVIRDISSLCIFLTIALFLSDVL